MRFIVAFVGGLGTSMLLVLFVLFAMFNFIVYTPHVLGQGYVSFDVQPGETTSGIANKLAKARIINDPLLFYLYTLKRGVNNQLKAGRYAFQSPISMAAVAMSLAYGKTVPTDITVTIPEGFTMKQIQARLEAAHLPTQALGAPVRAALKRRFSFLSDVPDGASLEGYLFPDTYRFAKDSTAAEVRDRFLTNFADTVGPLIKDTPAVSQKHSLAQVITMASLLEREVKTLKDKELVAGILWKRLQAGMPLQLDATVAYARAVGDDTYNTYKNRGLPPGPIANPGVESITAALSPIDSPYWYYLSAPDGATIFSKTFDDHIAAKNRYLK